jgi:hypothetical protein
MARASKLVILISKLLAECRRSFGGRQKNESREPDHTTDKSWPRVPKVSVLIPRIAHVTLLNPSMIARNILEVEMGR